MSNHTFSKDRGALERIVRDLFLEATIGSTGAITLVANRYKGITSVTRLGVGQYLVLLDDFYHHLLAPLYSSEVAAAAPAAPSLWLQANGSDQLGFGVITLSGMVATDTITINGVTFTCMASGATGNQFNVGGSDALTATAFVTAFNASTSAAVAGITATQIAAGAKIAIKSKVSKAAWSISAHGTLTPTGTLSNPGLLVCFHAAGTATEVASGERIRLSFVMADTAAF